MVTKLKRLLPDSAYPNKLCNWCGAVLIRKRQSKSEWDRINTCGGSCATFWKWHKISKEEYDAKRSLIPDKFCGHCHELLKRNEGEKISAWDKRTHCNKVCGSFGKVRQEAVHPKAEEAVEAKLGLKRYEPGSAEFAKIASLYGG